MTKYRNSDKKLQKYLEAINKYPLLTLEEEIELAIRIQNGDDKALKKIIRSNLRFVVSIVKKFTNKVTLNKMSILDLINEGNIGLIEAAKRYKPEKKVKFITYAVWWIRQSIFNALSGQCRLIKLPLKQIEFQFNLEKTIKVLRQNLKREPTNQEVADFLNIDIQRLINFQRHLQSVFSLDNCCENDDNVKLVNIIEDINNEDIETIVVDITLHNIIDDLLKKLPEREAKIIKFRFGLGDQVPLTLDEVGKIFGVTRERIRQLENKALKKLSKIALKLKLKDCLN